MNIKNKLKEKKGIITADAIISILIILLFVGVVASLMTNIVLQNSRIKLQTKQMDIAQDIMEYVKKTPYSEVTESNIRNYLNNVSPLRGDSAHLVQISVEPYNETTGNTQKIDIIKIITITVRSSLKGETYSTQVQGLKKMTEEEIRNAYGSIT